MNDKFDKFFWFRNNRILIDGVKQEHLFMHISDLHLHVIDDLSTPEEKAKAIETQIISSAENQIKYIEKNTDNAVWAEEKIITAKIEKDTFDKASALAKKQIIQMLKNNPELHNKFIKESIEVI